MKALLVVDIQKGLTCRKGFYNKTQFFNTVNAAIDFFREHNLPIIYIQHINKMLLKGTTDWEIDSRVKITPNDLILQKEHGSAFQNTDLLNILKQNGVDKILVCGLSSQHCVSATCLGGVKNGFRVFILENGHSNWTKNAEETVALVEKKLQENGVKIVNLQYLSSLNDTKS
jgi:nicotinamidase-related amidase